MWWPSNHGGGRAALHHSNSLRWGVRALLQGEEARRASHWGREVLILECPRANIYRADDGTLSHADIMSFVDAVCFCLCSVTRSSWRSTPTSGITWGSCTRSLRYKAQYIWTTSRTTTMAPSNIWMLSGSNHCDLHRCKKISDRSLFLIHFLLNYSIVPAGPNVLGDLVLPHDRDRFLTAAWAISSTKSMLSPLMASKKFVCFILLSFCCWYSSL